MKYLFSLIGIAVFSSALFGSSKESIDENNGKLTTSELRKSGCGVLSLSMSNNYLDETTISDGTLEFTFLGDLGSGVILDGGALQFKSEKSSPPIYVNVKGIFGRENFKLEHDYVNRSVVYERNGESFHFTYDEILERASKYDLADQEMRIEFEKFLPLYEFLLLPDSLSRIFLERGDAFELAQSEPRFVLGLSIIMLHYYFEINLDAKDLIDCADIAYKCLTAKGEDHPFEAWKWFFLGRNKLGKGEQLLAYKYFMKAYHFFDNYPEAEFYKYFASLPEKCTQAYQQALCLIYAAKALVQLDRPEKASERLDQAIGKLDKIYSDSHNSEYFVLYEKAKAALEEKLPEKAERFLEAMIAFKISSPVINGAVSDQ